MSIVLTPLMGTSPDAYHQTLTNIYVSQIATLVWSSSEANIQPVVVGVALSKKSGVRDTDTEMAEGEREMFIEVMEMVKEALLPQSSGS
jgi:proteasome assembly chaperone 3